MEQKKTKLDLIDERSEQVMDTLGRVPSWILRWGISILFGVVILLLALATIIKYPDIITAQVTITSMNPPARVVSKASAELDSIWVRENVAVQQHQVLGVLKNPARAQDVFKLKSILDAVNTVSQNFEFLLSTAVPDNLHVGEIQAEYSNFIYELNNYRFFKHLDPINREIKILQHSIIEYKAILEKYQSQKITFSKELALLKSDYERDRKLFESRSISQKALDDKERDYLSLTRDYEALDLEISNTKLRLLELELRLNNLTFDNQERNRTFDFKFLKSITDLKTKIEFWEQKFVLRAPVAGQLSFMKYWKANQFVKAEEEIFSILPERDEKVFGKMLVPRYNSGKAKRGQKVIIRLQDFPPHEFGFLVGIVTEVSDVSQSDQYAIDVALPENLVTSYKKTLPLKPEMKGQAEIVTEDLRFIERIYYQFRSLFKDSSI